MLACIACSKPELEEDGGAQGGAARNNKGDAVKSLSLQIKDMVLKFSGSYRQCKRGGGGGSGGTRRNGYDRHTHQRTSYMYHHDEEEEENGGHDYAYLTAASSSSTPAWDFTGIGGTTDYKRLNGASKMAAAGEGEEDVVLEEESGEPKEWMAQVEPGVHVTFVSLPGGAGNDLKRIRFSREMFNKWQAQRWWGENYDRIMELYNVQRFSRQAPNTPTVSDDGERRESFYTRVGSSSSTRESPAATPKFRERSARGIPNAVPAVRRASPASSSNYYGFPSVPDPTLAHHLNPAPITTTTYSVDASRTTTSSRDDAASISISNASDMETSEWVEQDEPGVYITIRELADGTRELRRVRFSRDKFGEVHAKLWWEENRERIHAQYL